jgi:putative flippase GtrA
MELLKRAHVFRQFIQFQFVGVLNVAIDFGVFSVLYYSLGTGYGAAQAISYACGALNSYILNRNWTFRAEGQLSRWAIALFVLLNGLCLGLSVVLLDRFTDRFGLPVLLSKVLVTLIVMVINFTVSKYVVFKRQPPSNRRGLS